ncbi:unnamed protein product, partial [marine sediment metagenome]
LSLLPDKKDFQLEDSHILTNPEAYLEIKIFKHIAQPYNAMVENIEQIKDGILSADDKLIPISERIYRMSEAKQHVIKEKFDMMVRASIGHDIFYNNNRKYSHYNS